MAVVGHIPFFERYKTNYRIEQLRIRIAAVGRMGKKGIARLVEARSGKRLPSGFSLWEESTTTTGLPSKDQNLKTPYPPTEFKMLQNALIGYSGRSLDQKIGFLKLLTPQQKNHKPTFLPSLLSGLLPVLH
jgi:hypothetical protein